MSSIENLTATQVFALSKAVKAAQSKAARAEFGAGEHIVPTFQVEVGGSLKVSADEEYVPTTSISLIGATSMALRRMGIQRGPFLKAMKEACQEALQSDEATRAALMADANVAEFEAAFREEFTAQLPKASRRGKVKAVLETKAL